MREPLHQRYRREDTALCAFTRDTPALFERWWNDIELTTSMGDWTFMPLPYAGQNAEEYCKRIANTTWLIGAVEAEERIVPIGYTGIFIKQRHRVGIFRIAIPERSYRGKGHARRATGMFLEWAFLDLDLLAVHLTVSGSNARAIDLYRACGFIECGRYTNSRHERAGRSDEVHMEILRDAWEERRNDV